MYKDINSPESTVTDVVAIKNSMKNILLTQVGSVPGNPRFGSNLYNVVFSPIDHLTESIAKNYVKEALNEFEDRILLKDVILSRSEEFNRLIVEVKFSYVDDSLDEIDTSVSVPFSL